MVWRWSEEECLDMAEVERWRKFLNHGGMLEVFEENYVTLPMTIH